MTVGFQWIPRGWSPGTLRFGELEKVLPQNTPTKSITACSVGYIMLWMISTLLHFFHKNLYWFFGGVGFFVCLFFWGKIEESTQVLKVSSLQSGIGMVPYYYMYVKEKKDSKAGNDFANHLPMHSFVHSHIDSETLTLCHGRF